MLSSASFPLDASNFLSFPLGPRPRPYGRRGCAADYRMQLELTRRYSLLDCLAFLDSLLIEPVSCFRETPLRWPAYV